MDAELNANLICVQSCSDFEGIESCKRSITQGLLKYFFSPPIIIIFEMCCLQRITFCWLELYDLNWSFG